MLLQMVNEQSFGAKIYLHVIRWQKAKRQKQYCCMLVAVSDIEKLKEQVEDQGWYKCTEQETGGKRANASMRVNGKREQDCTAVVECCNYLFPKYL
jgi:hypothetical protein